MNKQLPTILRPMRSLLLAWHLLCLLILKTSHVEYLSPSLKKEPLSPEENHTHLQSFQKWV